MTETLICPSLLAANFGNLEKDLMMINESKADYLHMDIMDGVFVPNISFGEPVCQYVKNLCHKPLDYHLMISKADDYLEHFMGLGAANITVHYEACTHLHRTVSKIRELGATAGISLNPHTPVSVLENIISEVDVVLIMSVNPGFGGQQFIPFSLDKIKAVKQLADLKNPNLKEVADIIEAIA